MTRILFLLALVACTPPQAPAARDLHVSAAGRLTRRCTTSRFASWRMRASAAGSDCSVLVVQTPMVLDDAMVEALHYGAGAYDLYDGGVERFARAGRFRAVAYRDGSGRMWKYGDFPASEALRPCR